MQRASRGGFAPAHSLVQLGVMVYRSVMRASAPASRMLPTLVFSRAAAKRKMQARAGAITHREGHMLDLSTSVGLIRRARVLTCAVIGLALLGCASESPSAREQAGAELGTLEAAVTPGFQAIAPCLSESDYVSRAVVRFLDGTYSPRCLRLASGGTVVFQGDLAVHPLQPRSGGTTPSPIVATSAYGQVEFEFPDHGVYPYEDAAHPEQIGVIWSTYY